MVEDTIQSAKKLRPSDDIVRDLLKLRDELFLRTAPESAEAFLKINSCLYRGYK